MNGNISLAKLTRELCAYSNWRVVGVSGGNTVQHRLQSPSPSTPFPTVPVPRKCLSTLRNAQNIQTNWTLWVKHARARYRVPSVSAPLPPNFRKMHVWSISDQIEQDRKSDTETTLEQNKRLLIDASTNIKKVTNPNHPPCAPSAGKTNLLSVCC